MKKILLLSAFVLSAPFAFAADVTITGSGTGKVEMIGGAGASDTNDVRFFDMAAGSFDVFDASSPVTTVFSTGSQNITMYELQPDTTRYMWTTFVVPSNADTTATVTFRMISKSSTSQSGNIEYRLLSRATANGEPTNGAFVETVSGALAIDTTAWDENNHTFTATMSALGWAQNDKVRLGVSRYIGGLVDNVTGSMLFEHMQIAIPEE